MNDGYGRAARRRSAGGAQQAPEGLDAARSTAPAPQRRRVQPLVRGRDEQARRSVDRRAFLQRMTEPFRVAGEDIVVWASGTRSCRRARTRASTHSATPTPPCTMPRRAATAASRSSTSRCAAGAGARAGSRAACGVRSSATSFASPTSRSSRCRRVGAGVRGARALAAPTARPARTRRDSSRSPRRPAASRARRVGARGGLPAGHDLECAPGPDAAPLRISVNLSARQVTRPALAALVASVLDRPASRPAAARARAHRERC